MTRFRTSFLRSGATALLGLGGCALWACDALITRPSLYATVTATVARRDGTPIPNAALTLYTGQRPMGYAVTDTLGRYTFVNVPEGLYGVRAEPPSGYARLETLLSTTAPSEVVQNIRVMAQARDSARFTFLKVGPGTVTAEVKEPDGSGVPDIALVLYGAGGVVRRSVTNAAGRFVFDAVPFGNYGVFAVRPSLYLDVGESSLPARDGLIIEDGSTQIASFAFAKCLGSIAVQLRDNTGQSVPGALLTLYAGSGVISNTPASASGTASFPDLRCNEYGVRVSVPRGWTATEARGVTFADALRVRRGSALSAVLTLERIPRAAVRVRVVDQRDAAVPNVRTVLYTGAGLERDVVTGADGTVTMNDVLVGPEYGVRVVPPTGLTATEGRGQTYVDGLRLNGGETRTLTFRFVRP
jgi:hypothetical protein